jgi:hypothetical protein
MPIFFFYMLQIKGNEVTNIIKLSFAQRKRLEKIPNQRNLYILRVFSLHDIS